MADEGNGRARTKVEVAIKAIRENLLDVIAADQTFDDDYYLLQWLKAQSLNVDKTEAMIRKSIKWRQDGSIHTNIADEFSSDFLKRFRISFSKSKDGIPIVHINAGAMDAKMAVTDVGRIRWIKYWAMCTAQAEEQMIAYNKSKTMDTQVINSDSTSGVVVLVDTKNFSSLQLLNLDVIRCAVAIVGNMMNFFPALCSSVIFYNMNSGFKILFNAFKSLLTGPSLTVEVYGSDEKVWRKRLLEIIHLEDLNELESYWK